MPELIICSNCEGKILDDSDFCPHCGYVLTGEKLLCELHPEKDAGGVCIICQRLVCELCSEESERRVFFSTILK